MSALMLTVEALVAPGDRVVVVTPLWPNLVEIPKILAANVECVPLGLHGAAAGRSTSTACLPRSHRRRACCSSTRPTIPTGWTLDRAAQQALLDHCRRHGIWIVADDVYERLYFRDDAPAAPSFLDLADAEERVISTNSFSKAWLMTGWRLGWIVAPQALMDDLGKLIEYNTSCSPAFVQHAGVAAIRDGEPTVARTRGAAARRARLPGRTNCSGCPGVTVAPPPGAMYAFFRIDGLTDSLAFCKELVRDAKLGLAPGRAFGPEGEGFVRWCFASERDGSPTAWTGSRAFSRADGLPARMKDIARSTRGGQTVLVR